MLGKGIDLDSSVGEVKVCGFVLLINVCSLHDYVECVNVRGDIVLFFFFNMIVLLRGIPPPRTKD